MNQLQVVQHPVSKFIFMEGNQGATDSLTVSQIFGKRHDNVMADIRSQMSHASQQQAIRNASNRRVYKIWDDGTINHVVHDSRRSSSHLHGKT
ncbi:hypothetical protein [Bacillus thuringiensis]|uniref:hypothetical protein n=1 Tax=Bacillus thuringiensis TaxID=1428 RepID=UPI0037D10683